jgi:PKD repeat protein
MTAVFAPSDASAAGTTGLTIKKLASDKTTVLAQKTVTWQELAAGVLNDGTAIPIMGDGITHYYHQGPIFVDDPDPVVQEALRWNPAEDFNWYGKDYGALKGTNVTDLCNLVGGMTAGEEVKVLAADGWYKMYAYKNVYEYPSRTGPMVVTWEKNGLNPETGYNEGMRLVWFAEATWHDATDTSMGSPNPAGMYHVFGNYDWHESAEQKYWYYYSGQYPTTTGLSGQFCSQLIIYSDDPAPIAPMAAFTADQTSGYVPLTVQFNDQSTNTPASWAWDFDNNGTVDSTLQNPSCEYSAAGTYSVKLTVTNVYGSDDELKTGYVTVNPLPVIPVAAFIAEPTSGNAPLTVQFNDQSTNTPTSWAWDFNNDGTVDSTDQSPSHVYDIAGTYGVKLTVTNADGSDDEVKADYITVSVAPLTPPALAADITDNIVGQAAVITFSDDRAWRGAITDITVDGSSIAGLYRLGRGSITINGSVFTAAGDYDIVVKSAGYDDASVSQTVLPPPPVLTGITAVPDAITINAGETFNITVTANYSDGSTRDVTADTAFSSSSKKVATVDSSGLVTGIKSGSAVIKVKYNRITAQANVTVN